MLTKRACKRGLSGSTGNRSQTPGIPSGAHFLRLVLLWKTDPTSILARPKTCQNELSSCSKIALINVKVHPSCSEVDHRSMRNAEKLTPPSPLSSLWIVQGYPLTRVSGCPSECLLADIKVIRSHHQSINNLKTYGNSAGSRALKQHPWMIHGCA